MGTDKTIDAQGGEGDDAQEVGGFDQVGSFAAQIDDPADENAQDVDLVFEGVGAGAFKTRQLGGR